VSVLGDGLREVANGWARRQDILVLALKVDLLSDRLVESLEAIERARALADEWDNAGEAVGWGEAIREALDGGREYH